MKLHLSPQQTPRFIRSVPDTTEYLCPEGLKQQGQAPFPPKHRDLHVGLTTFNSNIGPRREKLSQNSQEKRGM